MKVTIDPTHICSIHCTYALVFEDGYTFSSQDSNTYHPSFETVRRILESHGYLKTETWHNGDRVLKPFVMNGYQFSVDDQFPCPDACFWNAIRNQELK